MANTTTITGNLTREPEIRYTKEGQATTQLGVAVNRRWQDRTTQEWHEATSFFDVVCWRDLAENVALTLRGGQAGASLTPSPTMPVGPWRASISAMAVTLSAGSRPARCSPTPSSRAIAAAVPALSPVSMMVRRPSRCSSASTRAASGRGRSARRIQPIGPLWAVRATAVPTALELSARSSWSWNSGRQRPASSM